MVAMVELEHQPCSQKSKNKQEHCHLPLSAWFSQQDPMTRSCPRVICGIGPRSTLLEGKIGWLKRLCSIALERSELFVTESQWLELLLVAGKGRSWRPPPGASHGCSTPSPARSQCAAPSKLDIENARRGLNF